MPNTIGPWPSTDAEKKVLLDDLKLAMSIDRAVAEMKAHNANKPLTFDDLKPGDVVVCKVRATGEERRFIVKS